MRRPILLLLHAIHDRCRQMAFPQPAGCRRAERFLLHQPVCSFTELPELSSIQFRQLTEVVFAQRFGRDLATGLPFYNDAVSLSRRSSSLHSVRR
ncbi:hypothetical protein ACLB1Q_36130 [Escherichia coli]